MANATRNTSPVDLKPGGDRSMWAVYDAGITGLGVEPMNARSVILSSLLGSHPPRQSVSALVALAERFGIRPGTVRTSLSRMVAAGDLATDDARYWLTDRLLERQREQETGRRENDAKWDGTWWSVLVESDRRTVADRRAFRSSMRGARMAELRPDIWLRPANVAAPPRANGVLVSRGPLSADDVPALVERLWDLEGIEELAQRLERTLVAHRPVIDSSDADAALPMTFTIAAAAVRFLRTEPQLPIELTPERWTAPLIRRLYADFSTAFETQLRVFFART